MQRSYLVTPVILLATIALYGGFLSNPVLFDDTYFFSWGTIDSYTSVPNLLMPRNIMYWTFALTWQWFGRGLLAFRIESLFLHAAVAMALYGFLRELQRQLHKDVSQQSRLLPLLAALIFALHPAAVYGAAYLIQRTIVMATLFGLLSWCCFMRGLRSERQGWLWGSVVCYVLAVLSKEHAVMVPAVSAMLAIWWWRTQIELDRMPLHRLWSRLRLVFLAYALIATLVVLYQRGVIGTAYEFKADGLEVVVPQPAWLLSAITQGLLFFKYVGLWVLPNPLWMSVDMREPFASSLTSWPQLLGFMAFLIWPVMAGWLLWRGGRRGLVGFAMIAPWLLFATELISIRYQEIFVLYRSYLWAAPVFAVFIALTGLVREKMLGVLLVAVPLLLFPLALNRLSTFSHSFLLWDDAVRLAENKTNVSGLERLYSDRGFEFHGLKKFDMAIKDFNQAIAIRPDYDIAIGGRAAALAESGKELEALADFDTAIKMRPDYPPYRVNKARALLALGRIQEARASYQVACSLGWQPSCVKVAQLPNE